MIVGLRAPYSNGKIPPQQWRSCSLTCTGFKVAVNARKTHTLARGYEAVAEIKHRYDIYISLYLHPHVLSLEISDMMKRCALSLYTNVIKYIMTSWCYLQQKAISRA